jgi:hypothetical protein
VMSVAAVTSGTPEALSLLLTDFYSQKRLATVTPGPRNCP